MKKLRVILADDHAILRYGISMFLSRTDNIEIVGEASTGNDCIALYKKEKPDLSVIDIGMPGKDGFEVASRIREINPDAKILILSMHSDKKMLRKAQEAELNGYLLKSKPKEKILEAIQTIAAGGEVFSDSLFDNDKSQKKTASHTLTNREKEILNLVVEGYSSPEIAEKLYISRRTVDTHRTNLMQKLDIHNTASLVRFAIENNIVSSNK